jgi:hypothetical protein
MKLDNVEKGKFKICDNKFNQKKNSFSSAYSITRLSAVLRILALDVGDQIVVLRNTGNPVPLLIINKCNKLVLQFFSFWFMSKHSTFKMQTILQQQKTCNAIHLF